MKFLLVFQSLASIRGFLTGTALTLVLDVIFGTVYFFVLISYSGLLTAVALCVIPLYLSHGLYRGASNQAPASYRC